MNPREDGDRAPLASETLERLRRVATATLTTQLFKLGFRNTFLTGVKPVSPQRRMVGEALTLRFAPAREDLAVFENITRPDYPQRAAIESCAPGQVLVVDGRGVESAAIGGDIYMSRLKARGAAGCVVDGCVRDFASIRSAHRRGTGRPRGARAGEDQGRRAGAGNLSAGGENADRVRSLAQAAQVKTPNSRPRRRFGAMRAAESGSLSPAGEGWGEGKTARTRSQRCPAAPGCAVQVLVDSQPI